MLRRLIDKLYDGHKSTTIGRFAWLPVRPRNRFWRRQARNRLRWRLGLVQDVYFNEEHQEIVVGGIYPYRSLYKRVLRADPCVYCKERGGTIEHILPSSQGGQNNWSNYGSACHVCNQARGSGPLLLHLVQKHKADMRKRKPKTLKSTRPRFDKQGWK